MTYKRGHIEVGDRGEQIIHDALKLYGYRVEYSTDSAFDLLVNLNVKAEVKTALPTDGSNRNKTRWQFSFNRRTKTLCADLYFLVCLRARDLSPPTIYVIPRHALSDKLKKIDVTACPPYQYAGKYARFVQAWHLVSNAVAILHERAPIDSTDIPF